MFESRPGTTSSPLPMAWAGAFLQEVSSGQGPAWGEAPWELEGRGRPIWDSLGSGLMGPRVSPISGHTLAQA